MAHETDRALMLDWARTAEEAGFAYLSTIDKPNYDAWDPLVTLAGVAGVTERIGLATTILFGTAGSASMKEAAPRIREAFAKEGKETSPSPASRTSRSATTRRQRSPRAPTTSCATTDGCGRSPAT